MPIIYADEPGFLIHTRPYREHQQLAAVLSLNYGRINAVVVKPKLYLRPFQPLVLKFQPGHNLWRVLDGRANGKGFDFPLPRLFCAEYVNEVLYWTFFESGACPIFFASYIEVLEKLAAQPDANAALRKFELSLIQVLGYRLQFKHEDGSALDPMARYRYAPARGFYLAEDSDPNALSGARLLQIARQQRIESLKPILRMAVDELLNGRRLYSRIMYQQYLQQVTE